MRRRYSHSAFTLLELILVMLIIAVTVGMMVPSLHSFTARRETQNAVTTILSLANYARTQSVSEGRAYRLNFDPRANTVWLTAQNAGVYEDLKNDLAQHFAMPEGVKLDVSVQPQPTLMLVVPTDVQQSTNQPVLPFGQPVTQQQNSVVQNQHGSGMYMDFQPSGRIDPVYIKLTDARGDVTDIGCQSSTEMLHVLSTKEMQ